MLQFHRGTWKIAFNLRRVRKARGQSYQEYGGTLTIIDTLTRARVSPSIESHANVSSSSLPPISDDTILIKCPNLRDGTGRTFSVPRSILSRSPTFAAFFRSANYLHGSRTLLTFMSDPAACFEIVQQYLTEGPAVYTRVRLRVFVTIRYKLLDRLLVLIRLHALAHKLALPELESWAYDTIVELDRYVKPENCITLAGLVFASKAGFQPNIKSWCLGHIAKSFYLLRDNKEWRDLLWLLDVELFMRWEQWVELYIATESSSSTKSSSADGRTVEEVIIGMPTAELRYSANIAMQERTKAVCLQSSTLRLLEEENARTDKDDDDDNEWANAAEQLLHIDTTGKPNAPRVGDSPESAKAKSMLGISLEDGDSSKSTDDETDLLLMMERQRVFRSYPSSPSIKGNKSPAGVGTEKAREVMGLSPSSPSSSCSLPSPAKSMGTPQKRGSKGGLHCFLPTTPSKLGK